MEFEVPSIKLSLLLYQPPLIVQSIFCVSILMPHLTTADLAGITLLLQREMNELLTVC